MQSIGVFQTLSASASSRTANAGSLAIGVVMAMFTWFFVLRLGEYTLQGLATLVGIFAAGAIIAFVDKLRGGTDGLAWYAIGLLVGSLGFVVLGLIDPQGPWFPSDASASPSPLPTEGPSEAPTASPTG